MAGVGARERGGAAEAFLSCRHLLGDSFTATMACCPSLPARSPPLPELPISLLTAGLVGGRFGGGQAWLLGPSLIGCVVCLGARRSALTCSRSDRCRGWMTDWRPFVQGFLHPRVSASVASVAGSATLITQRWPARGYCASSCAGRPWPRGLSAWTPAPAVRWLAAARRRPDRCGPMECV